MIFPNSKYPPYLSGLVRITASAWLFVSLANVLVYAQLSELVLQARSNSQWAQMARKQGDARKGAVAFYQGGLACARCHLPDSVGKYSLGPNLGHVSPIDDSLRLADEQLVESVLNPSANVRKGYESLTFKLEDGSIVSGLLVNRNAETIELRNANGELVEVVREEIEEESRSTQSLMPAGLVLQLSSEQSLLDLLAYLFEVQAGGPQAASSLQPDLALLATKVPAYESNIDHAGFVQEWNQESFNRGQAIYTRVCSNCHGTKELLGSLPTALRFGEGKFKRGDDPYSMYQTLTHGYGFMPAQSWMVPSQKYDVIHYIRETFFSGNPNVSNNQIDPTYLAGLPKGDSRGPQPSNIEVWSAMDYGNMLTHCYEVPGDRHNIAYKGIAVRLNPGPGGIARGSQWMLFDTDTLRWAAAWESTGESNQPSFIDWRDIQFNGEHGIHPRIRGEIAFANSVGPGWGSPKNSAQDDSNAEQKEDIFDDSQRVVGRDQRRYGPLPKDWGRYQGQFVNGSQTVLAYSVGQTQILEMPKAISAQDGATWFGRVLNIAPHTESIQVRLADIDPAVMSELPGLAKLTEGDSKEDSVMVGRFGQKMMILSGQHEGVDWSLDAGRLTLRISPSADARRLAIWIGNWQEVYSVILDARAATASWVAPFLAEDLNLLAKTKGSPSRWPEILQSTTATTVSKGAFGVDTILSPEPNPWLAQMRFTGLDFYSDGSMAVCSWDGDVWHVREDYENNRWLWKRMVSGLYQPLGLKIVDDQVYLTCRDQLATLHDLNGDDETDFIECFNNDHQVTEHFHEFAMGLQTDQEGNFYYAKSGRHALTAVVPQHGTLLKVSADGEKTEILATGFRAANGVCMNKDGSFIVTDQEGFWNPKNRINWVKVEPGQGPKFYGNMFGYHDVTDTSDEAMEPPLCWITNAFDRSPSELLWVDSPTWGELQGGLLNLSYGYGKVFLVLHEEVDGLHQGGMIELPIPAFPTGVMRGRFSPGDHHLYLCGMFSWAGNATAPGGLYRIRKLPQANYLPTAMHVSENAITLDFAHPLDPTSLGPESVQIRQWGLKRSRNYGSEHINERSVPVDSTSIEISPSTTGASTLRIEVNELEPTWGMEIRYTLKSQTGEPVQGVIHNTIHRTSAAK